MKYLLKALVVLLVPMMLRFYDVLSGGSLFSATLFILSLPLTLGYIIYAFARGVRGVRKATTPSLVSDDTRTPTSVKIAIGVIIILLLTYVGAWLVLGPSPFTYMQYIVQANAGSGGALATVSCGDISLRVTQVRVAYKGGISTIDTGGFPPGIREDNHLVAYNNSRQLFDIGMRGDEVLPINTTGRVAVTDQGLFESYKRNESNPYEKPWFITFRSGSISKDDFDSMAHCYAEHSKELNAAYGYPVTAFILN